MRLQVVCPNKECRAILGFDVESPINPETIIGCPKCKSKYRYKEYLPVQMKGNAHFSTSGNSDGEETLYDKTLVASLQMRIGSLQLVGHKEVYPLQKGHNVIGRQAETCTATIQIPDYNKERTMSRAHLDIDVIVQPTIVKHVVSLSPGGEKNTTRVNGVELRPESKFFLNDGDKITIGNQTLLFCIVDEEGTVPAGK